MGRPRFSSVMFVAHLIKGLSAESGDFAGAVLRLEASGGLVLFG